MAAALPQAEQVVAGLLQQEVVVTFVRAVGVVVVPEVAQTVHCREATGSSSRRAWMGRSLPRCPGLRGPRPAWTGQGTSHPAPGPSSPQPAGPLHPAGPERVHWGHLARKGSGQLPAKAQHRLGSSGCSRGIHCPQWPHGYHERHRSPGKAPSWGVTDRRDGFRRADCQGWGGVSSFYPPRSPSSYTSHVQYLKTMLQTLSGCSQRHGGCRVRGPALSLLASPSSASLREPLCLGGQRPGWCGLGGIA